MPADFPVAADGFGIPLLADVDVHPFRISGAVAIHRARSVRRELACDRIRRQEGEYS